MLRVAGSLFLAGLFLGYGPCLLSCGPLLVAYIAATHANAEEGLKTYLVFSLTRLVVYSVFGVMAGVIGARVIPYFFESQALKILFFIFGVFLIFLGMFFSLEKVAPQRTCRSFFEKHPAKKTVKDAILFGLIISFAPCLPLLGILGYIVLISDTWLKGIVYMAAFGLGTVVSPMIFLSMTAGWVAKFSMKHETFQRVLKVFCGLVLIYLGTRLVFSF